MPHAPESFPGHVLFLPVKFQFVCEMKMIALAGNGILRMPGNGLPRRFAPRNDVEECQPFAPKSVLIVSNYHVIARPVRTLAWQSPSEEVTSPNSVILSERSESKDPYPFLLLRERILRLRRTVCGCAQNDILGTLCNLSIMLLKADSLNFSLSFSSHPDVGADVPQSAPTELFEKYKFEAYKTKACCGCSRLFMQLRFPVVPDVLHIVIPRAKPSVGKLKTCCKSSSFQFCASPKGLEISLCISQPI